MNLADKPVYTQPYERTETVLNKSISTQDAMGITYKEALVLALAGNPAFVQCRKYDKDDFDYYETAVDIIGQADEIIKQMEKKWAKLNILYSYITDWKMGLKNGSSGKML